MTGVIVHEWLEKNGGAEKVVDRLASIYPDAPIVSLWNDAPGRFPDERVSESWLARTPLRGRKALALPLMPATWRRLGDSSAEWVLCSSHLFAHHARFSGPASTAPTYVYAYTPARYIWEPDVDDRGASPAVRAAARFLRPLDKKRAHEAHSVAAISRFVQERIARTWERDTEVIYPPVAVSDFTGEPRLTASDERQLNGLPREFLLGASRWVSYKKLDEVIRAGSLTNLPVVIAGAGPDDARLRALAERSDTRVAFVHKPSQALLHELYRRCLAFVFPAIEDFGIMPVEAMAAGTPVIGPVLGGVSETVVDGESGVLVESFASRSELNDAVDRAQSIAPEATAARAEVFDQSHFDLAIRGWVGDV